VSAREIRTCSECPAYRAILGHRVAECQNTPYDAGDGGHRGMGPTDTDPPVWCPLREGPIVLRLVKEAT
jgi:hypothetical protein